MSKYVIIGGCAAGISAVEAIREVDQVGTITVISEEPCPQYSRPMISDFVGGKAYLEKMKTRDDKFWTKQSVEALTGQRAVKLDTVKKFVTLENGTKVTYEKLLIATGGKPFVPKIDGLDKDGVFTFTSLSDAERLVSKIEAMQLKKAVVVGAGLIGISLTEALVKRGLQVTLVELQDKILSLILDPVASDLVANTIRSLGVEIITGQSVKNVLGKPETPNVVGGVLLTNGCQVLCDCVIFAIGVIPRTELVVGTDIKTNRGIIVDNYMQTTVPDVYASGDVAEVYDFVLNQNRLLPLWPLAVLEGKVAGYNMAGKKTEYSGGTNMSSLKYFGIPIVSIGLTNPKDVSSLEVLSAQSAEENVYKKLVLKDNVIVGMIFVNDIEKAGIFFYLMKNKINVQNFKHVLLSKTFSLATLPEAIRKEMKISE
ncbi:MAG: FAD-dependent oxidoreductase [Candidatus Bathyarchaeota archaeon]|nr:FAD-dependent oxidoreductase [Candidatus Bathyarchaeota archaeon]